jgi:Rieske Fe-S protein
VRVRPYELAASGRTASRDTGLKHRMEVGSAPSTTSAHEGVTLTSGDGVVAKNRIVCMLHSSEFDVATSEVLAGPAPDLRSPGSERGVFLVLPG